jgi:YidC/Oxa1 family membrane protein insertase
MKLYKEHGVNPCGSCLPILIQMPILIAVFQVLQVKNSIDNAKYLYPFLTGFDFEKIQTSFFWVNDLIEPERIVLPILVGLSQFVSVWLMQRKAAQMKPKKPKTDKKGSVNPMEEMEMATKMMTYVLPFMVAWFAYTYPAGLALYWFVSTLFSILQQFLLQRHKEALQAKKQ